MSEAVKKKSPNIDLRGAVGHYLIGTIKHRIESRNYPGTFSALIEIEDTNGSTVLWDGEKEVEVDVAAGDTVFLKETRWLTKFMSENVGNRVRIEYTGTQKAKVKGRKATFTYNTEVL
jgi:hypothetical protein